MCYATSLACQENIMAPTIRSGTISQYLYAASPWATHGNSNLYSIPNLTPWANQHTASRMSSMNKNDGNQCLTNRNH